MNRSNIRITPDEIRSMSAVELTATLADLNTELLSLHYDDEGEFRNLSTQEQNEFERLVNLRNLAQNHKQVADQLGKPGATRAAYGGNRRAASWTVDVDDVRNMSGQQVREVALRGLETRSNLEPDQLDRVDRLIRSSVTEDDPHLDGSQLARRIALTENDAYRSAWKRMVTDPKPMLTDEETNAIRAYTSWERTEARAMSEGGTGGLGIPVFIDPSIIMTAQGSGNPFYQIARQVDVNTNVWKGVSSAGVTWSFDAEGVEVSDDAPTLAQPTVTIYTARGFIPFSIELGMDYPGFATEMSSLLAEGYDELLVDKFTRGSGTAEPFGILTVLSASAGNRVSIQTSGSNFGAQDPYSVWKALPQRFRRRASWMMSVDVNNKIRQLGTANVFHAFTESLPAEWADVLFGKAVYESPYMPDTTTSTSANSGLAIVGDFRGFVIARRLGLNVELVNHLLSTTTNLPNLQRGWLAYARIGSNVVNTSALRLLVNTA